MCHKERSSGDVVVVVVDVSSCDMFASERLLLFFVGLAVYLRLSVRLFFLLVWPSAHQQLQHVRPYVDVCIQIIIDTYSIISSKVVCKSITVFEIMSVDLMSIIHTYIPTCVRGRQPRS